MALIKIVGISFAICRKSVNTANIFFHLAFIIYGTTYLCISCCGYKNKNHKYSPLRAKSCDL